MLDKKHITPSRKEKAIFETAMRDIGVLPKKDRYDYEENALQSACVKWFRLQYRTYAKLLFAIPNGYNKSRVSAIKAKAEGLTAGVADLCLAISRGGYGALYIEMKQKGNYQQPNQREWQADCERVGNKYVVCKSIEEFMREVNAYMRMPLTKDLLNVTK